MSRLPLALAAMASLAACATTGEGSGNAAADAANPANTGRSREHAQAAPRVDREARQRISHEETLTQMAFWAGEYDTFPNDLEAAQRFAEVLRKGGRTDRSIAIAREALSRFPDDPSLLTTFGLAQVALERPQEALRPLQFVAEAQPDNWRVRSALGAALDQVGRFDEARQMYQEALALQPNNPGVMTNLGVSHLLEGDPADAEPILRQAAELPNAPPQARQNLAIAIALQGRFDEAEQIERADLPAAAARSNMSYLRSLLSDPRRWNDMGRS